MTEVVKVKVSRSKESEKPDHPPYAEMVLAAINNLQEKRGTSLQAIKKYVATTYGIDSDSSKLYIKKFLAKAVDEGKLTHTKGTGANGRYKLPSVPVKKSARTPKKTKSATSAVAAKPKKKDAPKKSVKKVAEKKPKVVAAKKAPKPEVKKVEKKKSAKAPVEKKASTRPTRSSGSKE